LSEELPADPTLADSWALEWKKRRDAAKAARNYGESDRIRDLLRSKGYEIRDSRAGSEVVRAG
jgi:cysteinyl-tRNA synthetase